MQLPYPPTNMHYVAVEEKKLHSNSAISNMNLLRAHYLIITVESSFVFSRLAFSFCSLICIILVQSSHHMFSLYLL